MTEPVTILKLEDLLAGDDTGGERDRLLLRLAEYRLVFMRELNRGVRPERYQQLTRLIDAVDAATTVVPRLWARVQQR